MKQVIDRYEIVTITYVGRLFSDDRTKEFRDSHEYPIPMAKASILTLRSVGVLSENSLAVTADSLEINDDGFVFSFPQGRVSYFPEEWFWNFGPVQNEHCKYALEQYQILLPELRKPRKRGERGKAKTRQADWDKRCQLEAWVYYYRNIEKLGHAASVLTALRYHPELVPRYLVAPEDALLKSTKLNG